ncbi:MAG: hypothetical protein AMXMBFR83_27110 [Phycisphaerae bacterium]
MRLIGNAKRRSPGHERLPAAGRSRAADATRAMTVVRGASVVIACAALLAAGCSEPIGGGAGPSGSGRWRIGDYASRRLPGVTLSAAQPVAEDVFSTRFRIDPDQSTGDVLVARPADAPDLEQSGQSGDLLNITPRRKRRLAELRLVPEGGTVVVQVRVMAQRLSTAERAAFAGTHGEDRPTDTAIDRRGATSTSAREEWVDWRRDRRLEEEILREIQGAFTATQPAGGTPP